MIAKIHKSTALGNTLAYVFQEVKGAEIVESTGGVHDRESALKTLGDSIAQRPGIKAPVWHAMLSVRPGEEVGKQEWAGIVDTYMERMGFGACTYVAVEHKDTDHRHVHIVASRVDQTGRLVSDSNERWRSQDVVRALEKEYELERVPSSWEHERTLGRALSQAEYHRGERTGEESVKERIRRELSEVLSSRPNDMVEVSRELGDVGIAMVPKVTKAGDRITGVYFESQGVRISGSKVAREYSWGRLTKAVGWEKARDFDRLVRAPEDHRTGERGRGEGQPERLGGGRDATVRGREVDVSKASPSSEGQGATQTKETGREAVEREAWKAHTRQVVTRAPEASWEQWACALKAHGVEPVPKVGVSDPGALRGMYYEAGGQVFKASEVSREHSAGKLIGRMGQVRPEGLSKTIEHVEVPGQGRRVWASELERAAGRDPVVEAYKAKLASQGLELIEPKGRFEGRWVGALRGQEGVTYGVVADDEKGRAALVRVDETLHMLVARQREGRLDATRALDGVDGVGANERVVVRVSGSTRALYVLEEPSRSASPLEQRAQQWRAQGVDVVRVEGELRGRFDGVYKDGQGRAFALVHQASQGRVGTIELTGELHTLGALEVEGKGIQAHARLDGPQDVPQGSAVVVRQRCDASAIYSLEALDQVREPEHQGHAREQESKGGRLAGDRVVVETKTLELSEWLKLQRRQGRSVELLTRGQQVEGVVSTKTLTTKDGVWRAVSPKNGPMVVVPDTPKLAEQAGHMTRVRHGFDREWRVQDLSRSKGRER